MCASGASGEDTRSYHTWSIGGDILQASCTVWLDRALGCGLRDMFVDLSRAHKERGVCYRMREMGIFRGEHVN